MRIVEPITGEPYLDREADFPCKIDHDDLCYHLFIEHGFEWGGDWEDRKDYQHFEIPTDVINEWYPDTITLPGTEPVSASIGSSFTPR